MPRSKNPGAYPDWTRLLYQKIATFQVPEEEFEIPCGTYQTAVAMRHEFYAYLVAKQHDVRSASPAERAKVEEEVYTIKRFSIGIQENAGIWVMKFRNRNTMPKAVDALMAVQALEPKSINPAGNSELPPEITDLGEFVDDTQQGIAKFLELSKLAAQKSKEKTDEP